jgi:hypothetical protein
VYFTSLFVSLISSSSSCTLHLSSSHHLSLLLKSIKTPSTVEEIGRNAFHICEKLCLLDLPKELKSIPLAVFGRCTALTSVLIPLTVEEIGNGAFIGCENLPSIEMAKGLKKIGARVFYGCKSLTNAVIPSTVDEMKLEIKLLTGVTL